MATNYYEGINHIVCVSTNAQGNCEHCNEGGFLGLDHLTKLVNHYITKHGYKILHAGTETDHGPDGNPWHSTVVILGKQEEP